MSTILNELVKIREKLDSDGTYSGSTAGVPETVTQIRELVENGAGSGGGKTFEVEEANNGFIVKATPEELYAGAMAVSKNPFGESALLCMFKGDDFLTHEPRAIFLRAYGEEETRTYLCTYDETQGGYVYSESDVDDPYVS